MENFGLKRVAMTIMKHDRPSAKDGARKDQLFSAYPREVLVERSATDQSRRGANVPDVETDGFRQFLHILGKGRRLIAASLAFCLISALVYLLLSPTRYVANAIMLIDPPVGAAQQQNQIDVGSQIQVLQSDIVAARVAKALGFAKPDQGIEADNKRFPRYLLRRLKAAVVETVPTLAAKSKKPDPLEAAVNTLKRNLAVDRIGIQTQAVEVTYNSVDPARAAAVVNAVVQAFMDIRSDSLTAAAERLQKQLADASRKAESAELAFENYKTTAGTLSPARYRIRLKELQTSALSLRKMHDVLLQRFIESEQDNSEPSLGASMLRSARVPTGPSEPRSVLVLTFAALLGLTLGTGMALIRDYVSDGFSSERELKEFLQTSVFGEFPFVAATSQDVEPNRSTKVCAELSGAVRLTLDTPQSKAAELMRTAQGAIDKLRTDRKSPLIVGIISAREGEGRTTIASNLAIVMTANGSRVLIVDADFRTQSLSSTMGLELCDGLAQILTTDAIPTDLLWNDPNSGATILPAGSGSENEDPAETLALAGQFASADVFMTIQLLSEQFDYVLVTLPPLESALVAGVAADWMDGFLLVVECENTNRNLLATGFEKSGDLSRRLIGAILNKVPENRSGQDARNRSKKPNSNRQSRRQR